MGLLALGAGSAAPVADAQTSPRPVTRSVTYRGVRLSVPASWPVYDLTRDPTRCVLFNTPAVYLGIQAADARCPAVSLGVSLAVELQPAGSDPIGLTPGSSLDNTTARRVSAVSGDGSVDATISYSVHDAALSGLLDDLGVRTAHPAPGPMAGAARVSATPTAGPAGYAVQPLSAVHTGLGFDTCGAPSIQTMANWFGSSPYRSAGIYIGGTNRACADGNLSAGWITTVARQGWTFVPTYVGLQAPCVNQAGLALIDPGSAASEGRAAADDAVSQASRFGLRATTPIYFDMEGYNNQVPGCSQTVLSFLSAWTAELHSRNYVSGVYGSSSSTIHDLGQAVGSGGIVAPDDIWLANWNGNAGVFGDPYVSDGLWAQHQRLHQYRGGHAETYAGSTLSVDSDFDDGAVASPGNGPPMSLQLFAATTAGRVLSSWQFAPSAAFGDWLDLGVTARAAGSPEIGTNQNGALQVFVHTSDNRLVTSWQAGPSQVFGGWADLGIDGQIASDPTLSRNSNGTMQVFAQGTGGRMLTSWQVGPNQAFGGWLDMGLPARAAGVPKVGVNQNGTMQVFVHTTDNRLVTSWQSGPSAPFGGWADLGIDGQVASDPAIGMNSNGTMQLFAQGTGGRMLTSWQVGPNQGFGGWLDMGLPARASGGPEVGVNQNGTMQVFVHTTDNRLVTSWQVGPSAPFGGWADLGIDGQIGSDPAIGMNSIGTMQVFVQGTGGRVLTSWQVGPNQGFGGWLDMGLPALALGVPEVGTNHSGAS